jgi:hypothetical protein
MQLLANSRLLQPGEVFDWLSKTLLAELAYPKVG